MNQGRFELYHEFLKLMGSPENSIIEVEALADSGQCVSPQLTLNLDLNINQYYDKRIEYSNEKKLKVNRSKFTGQPRHVSEFQDTYLPLMSSRSNSPSQIIHLQSENPTSCIHSTQMTDIDDISLCSFTDEENSYDFYLNESDLENEDDYNDVDENNIIEQQKEINIIEQNKEINPFAPILFPPINVKDETQFMSLSEVPLRPSFIEL